MFVLFYSTWIRNEELDSTVYAVCLLINCDLVDLAAHLHLFCFFYSTKTGKRPKTHSLFKSITVEMLSLTYSTKCQDHNQMRLFRVKTKCEQLLGHTPGSAEDLTKYSYSSECFNNNNININNKNIKPTDVGGRSGWQGSSGSEVLHLFFQWKK